jgi:lysozyme family protein
MADNFQPCLEWILQAEGGLSMNRADSGNWTGGRVGSGILKGTKFGISAASFPNLDIASLTIEQAGAIYRQRYWHEGLPTGVDLVVFDHAVNAGPSASAKLLQHACGTNPDGAIGPKTMAAVFAVKPAEIVQCMSTLRAGFYHGLVARIPGNAVFLNGWLRRVEATRQRALQMLGAQSAPQPAPVPPKPSGTVPYIGPGDNSADELNQQELDRLHGLI